MERIWILLNLMTLTICQTVYANINEIHNEPDSAYIFAYSPGKSDGHSGLHIAWSIDRVDWHTIGSDHSFVRCDYGSWGSEKRMNHPFLFQAPDGLWHCVWSLNEYDGAFAHAVSKDLAYWMRQSYPLVMEKGNCLMPEIVCEKTSGQYMVSWQSKEQFYYTTTRDFKAYAPAQKVVGNNLVSRRQEIVISGNVEKGTMHQVAWNTIEGLIQAQQLSAYNNELRSESTKTDPERFAGLQPVEAMITPDVAHRKKISDLLVGIFFEDINYAADGGLYAELIQNRDFEYAPADKSGRDKTWNSRKAWSLTGSGVTFMVDSTAPVHPNNKHYAVLQINNVGAGLVNEGFDGIVLQAGEKYEFSVFVRVLSEKGGKLIVRLVGANGKVYGEISVKVASNTWKKYDAVLTAKETVTDARLEIIPQMTGSVALDMISLFPQKTFKGRKNGLRADLAQTLADMKPRFVRFPGGCVAHGDGIENMYRWENTIGPLETRKPQRNLWNYHQTLGLGYFEYFQFCEDIGAEPLPVVPAGVPCQNSMHHGHPLGGLQGGIPMNEMDDYVQSVLNLIEWANGDAKTTWGRKRAEAGHPAPFNLKYIGVGNEDQITDIFEERFTMIFKAIKEKHPEITVIGTVGPFFEGTDYTEGWEIATKLGVSMVDEHYYVSPGWMIHHQDYYDRYDRSKSKVYLGEYAAHLPGRPNNVETALAEALYLTSLERNGDVVSMTSYAPLLAKEGHTQWNPDLIYFNNTEVNPTVGYYVQQLYGQNSGDEYISSNVKLSNNRDDVKKRVAVSFVRDSKNGDVIIKLVNLLPVSVRATIDLKDIPFIRKETIKTVLCGTPDDKNVKPEILPCAVSDNFISEFPAYSFTVIRVKTK